MKQIEFQETIGNEILKYAGYISARGWVCNTLGNIAVRLASDLDQNGVVYTKRKGISLEEMKGQDISITDVSAGKLLHGLKAPSVGHKLNREVFKHRKDVNAVIHLHINEAIAYFSIKGNENMKYISNDTALVLGKPVHVCERHLNVENAVDPIKDFIQGTNCFVMPNHGVTTLGRDVSEAYHCMCSFVAELQRVILSLNISKSTDQDVIFVSKDEIKDMESWGEDIIYGKDE